MVSLFKRTRGKQSSTVKILFLFLFSLAFCCDNLGTHWRVCCENRESACFFFFLLSVWELVFSAHFPLSSGVMEWRVLFSLEQASATNFHVSRQARSRWYGLTLSLFPSSPCLFPTFPVHHLGFTQLNVDEAVETNPAVMNPRWMNRPLLPRL